MNTGSLSLESVSDIQSWIGISLQIAPFQGLFTPFHESCSPDEGSYSVHVQSISDSMAIGEFMQLREKPLLYELKQEHTHILSRLTQVMRAKDALLYRHSLRVQFLALTLTSGLHLPEDEGLTIVLAAFLHDIGKIRINNTILFKASRLTRQEYEVVKAHTAYGAEMLSQFKMLKDVVPPVYHHHERWDGRGYPDGIRGDAIPLGARIVAIADTFEAMTSRRNYQNRRTPIQAIEELYKHAGTQFDARLVRLFSQSLETALKDPTCAR